MPPRLALLSRLLPSLSRAGASALLAAAILSPALCPGQTLLTAADQGQYTSAGSHFPSNINYITGNVDGVKYRSFYVFDIPLLDPWESITAAVLTLNTRNIRLDNLPSGALSFLAFTGDIAALRSPPGFISYPNYVALGSGTAIASASFTTANASSSISVTFNSAGTAWLESNRGSRVAFSAVFPGAESLFSGQNYIFGSSGFAGDTAQLALTTAIPEPSPALLLGFCCALLLRPAFARRRKRPAPAP